MKYFLTFLFIFSFNSNAFVLTKRFKRPDNLSTVRTIFNKFERKDFEKELRNFVSCCRPSRMVGTTGHQFAVSYIINRIKEIDTSGKNVLIVDEYKADIEFAISTFMKDFETQVEGKYPKNSSTYRQWHALTRNYVKTLEGIRSHKGKNIIWEKKGFLQPEETIVLGAHYDTLVIDKQKMKIIGGRQPGADNNASGVTILLTLIQILNEIDLPKTVRIVFFDHGEFGALGSKAYVKKYGDYHKKNKKFAGYLDLVMLGHDTKFQDKLKKNGNMKIYTRKASDASYGLDLKLQNLMTRSGKKLHSGVKFTPVANSFNSSGNISFWRAGLPAIVFTHDWENDYNQKLHHSSNDLIETLNMSTLYSSFHYIGGAVVAWAFDLL
jgi:hypothetical protein